MIPTADFGSTNALALLRGISWHSIQFPGLTRSAGELLGTARELEQEYAVYFYRARLPCLWVSCMGGTGTGKSTVFNGLAGREVSPAGVERPTTTSPVASGHRGLSIEEGFPFSSMRLKRVPVDTVPSFNDDPREHYFVYVEHDDDSRRHLVFVDTPDVDSVERRHRSIAEALYLLSHVIVFVTSQEKYADLIPSSLLQRMHREGKPFYLLFNKADKSQVEDELPAVFRDRGIPIRDSHFFTIPFINNAEKPEDILKAGLQRFIDAVLDEYPPSALHDVIKEEERRFRRILTEKTGRLLICSREEEEAGRAWLKELDDLTAHESGALLDTMAARYGEHNLQTLKKELRAIFSAYDLLARPRQYIMSILRAPFLFLIPGGSGSAGGRGQELLKVRGQVDTMPLVEAMERLNRLVLENLSPPDPDAPLFKALRDNRLPLGTETVEARISREQENLAGWLETTIRDLEAGLPKSKRLGIYTTSVLWGAAILSFQTVMGGGLALLELAFDAVLAPLITKGSVELFIYRELRMISREMNRRYQDGIHSIFMEQKERYEAVLKAHLTPEAVRENLLSLKACLEHEP
ncbi:MAG: GTPase domain-containing protein [Syntrophales bacterium]|jgi:GTPase Era involved in 16S rRNA processing|nr:GTPase domain-containing protein [Syntrophales bacterium]MCK9528221.1 GTPase domain-containing protein [Syntrophales bacterium]MDX9921369.1 GTPase domain-containing protein [Syntrophales bacterium]